MGHIFGGLFDCVKRKKGYCLFLIFLSVVAIVLGVIAAINFGSVLTIDLSHISYIKFLSGNCSFASMLFGLLLSLIVFFCVILLCHWKKFLLPFAVVFYLYLVYSQAVVFMSIVLIYGIFNCIILAVLLLAYSIMVWTIFLLLMCEFLWLNKSYSYFKTCFSLKESKVLIYLFFLCILVILFSLILTILKNYVILLIF